MNTQMLRKSAGQSRGQKQTRRNKALNDTSQIGTTSARTETCPYPKMLQGDNYLTHESMHNDIFEPLKELSGAPKSNKKR